LYVQSSQIKNTALKLLTLIDNLAKPRISNRVVKRFWDWFFVSHGKSAINSTSDEQLKIAMKEAYDVLRPIYETVNIATGIQEGEKLGSPKIAKIGDIKDIMDLIP